MGRNVLKDDDKPKSRALQAFRPQSPPPTILCRDMCWLVLSQVNLVQCGAFTILYSVTIGP